MGDFLAAVKRAKEIAARLKEEADKKRANEEEEEQAQKRQRDEDYEAYINSAPPSGVTDSFVAGFVPPSEEFLIPNVHVGKVIGKSGETINRIQTQTGCRVQISPDTSTPMRKSFLTGSKEAVEYAPRVVFDAHTRRQAKRMILDIIEEAGDKDGPAPSVVLSHSASNQTVQIMIPSGRVGLIIGKNGETIKMLQDRSGAKIQMMQDGEFTFRNEKPLRITGDEKSVKIADQLVRELLAEKTEFDLIPGGITSGDIALNLKEFKSVKLQVKVPRIAVGSVIGRGGETIKRIQGETGARMQFDPDENGPFRTASLSGTADMVRRAEEMVQEIIAESVNRNTKTGSSGNAVHMSVPASKCGLIIGRGGENIKVIQSQSGAHVELNRDAPADAPEKVFTITGTPQQIEAAQNLIRQKIDPRAPGAGSASGSAPAPGGYYPPGYSYPGYPQYQYPGYAYPGYPYPGGEENKDGGAGAAAAAAAPMTEAAAVAAGYPTQEQYLANQEWYNSQGYYGLPAAAPAAAAAPAVDDATAQDYAKQWEQYYAAQAAQGEGAAGESK